MTSAGRPAVGTALENGYDTPFCLVRAGIRCSVVSPTSVNSYATQVHVMSSNKQAEAKDAT